MRRADNGGGPALNRPGRMSGVVFALAVILALVLGLATVGGCTRRPRAVVRFDGGTVSAQVAADSDARARGLRGSPEPAPGQGMLFVWPGPGIRTFTIEGVPYGLDVILMDGPDDEVRAGDEVRVVDVVALSPLGARIATSPRPARWALEVPAGWAGANGVVPGSVASIEMP